MAPKHQSKGKGKSSRDSGTHGAWSDWEWSSDYRKYYRSRLRSNGDLEYEYADPETGQPNIDPSIPRSTEVEASHPSMQQIPSPPIQYSTPANYTTSQSLDPLTQAMSRVSVRPHPPETSFHIESSNTQTTEESFDKNFKVHLSKYFQWGQVLKLIWSEPSGGNSPNTDEGITTVRHGRRENSYTKVRRFVIVDPRDGHCICLPINTYSGKGVGKKGIHVNDHAIIHTDKKPVLLDAEKNKKGLRKPIRVKPASDRHKLDNASRLNYAKLYTIEHNVKVWFIGSIHPDSEHQLVKDYREVHPPMQRHGVPPASTSQDLAGLSNPTYPPAGQASAGYQQLYANSDSQAYAPGQQTYGSSSIAYQQAAHVPQVAVAPWANPQGGGYTSNPYPSSNVQTTQHAAGYQDPNFPQQFQQPDYPQQGYHQYQQYEYPQQGYQQSDQQQQEDLYGDEHHDQHGKKKKHHK